MSVQTKTKYTDEFRREAVKLVTEQGYKPTEAARNLGISASLLRKWVKRYKGDDSSLTPGKLGLNADQKRIRELEMENKRLKMEREILKKATAFFAKESN